MAHSKVSDPTFGAQLKENLKNIFPKKMVRVQNFLRVVQTGTKQVHNSGTFSCDPSPVRALRLSCGPAFVFKTTSKLSGYKTF